MKNLLITHTDMDGAASAGLYLYSTGISEYKVLYTEPYMMNEALKRVVADPPKKIAVFDIGVNPGVFSRVLEIITSLTAKGVEIEWFDHHVWEDEWAESLRQHGVNLFIDRETCGVGVVAKYALSGKHDADLDFLENLVNGVCGGDLWRFDHWLSPFYIRLVRRRDPVSWKNIVVKTISSGIYWDKVFEEKVLEEFETELQELSELSVNMAFEVFEANGFKIGVVQVKEDVENSFLASLALSRAGLDVAVIVSRDGKLSLRSRDVNVRDLAVALNGGGHLRASGAKIQVPFTVKMLTAISRKFLVEYVADLIRENASYLKRLGD
ncbi:MAG: DHH family phosphoesterase [Thermosphaera sp.]